MTRRWWHGASLAALAAFLAYGPAASGAGLPASVPSSNPMGAAGSDTAVIAFALPDSVAAPVVFHVVGDTVAFGGALRVAWDYPAGTAASRTSLPQPVGDDLVPAPVPVRRWWQYLRRSDPQAAAAETQAATLPPAGGVRLFESYRVYRTDPFRVVWGEQTSGVIFVRGRVEDPAGTAAIRDPRSLPYFTWKLGAIVAALLGLVLLALWLRRRLRAGPPVKDWVLPEPAWIAAALDLEALIVSRSVDRGEGRRFLDALAGIARRFVAARYRVAAVEMTGRELAAACAERGYPSNHPAGFARLIEAADKERYNPVEPSPQWCREQAAQLVQRVHRVRILPAQTFVQADRLLAAQKAWSVLVAELGNGTGRDAETAGAPVREGA